MSVSQPQPRSISVLALCVLSTALFLAPAFAEAGSDGNQTLYVRLGGFDGIAHFVDTAFPRVAGDPQLNRLFLGHSQDSQIRQRELIIEALCQASGGPCAYIGRDLATVHVGLAINDSDWRRFLGILSGAMDDVKMAPDVKRDFLELFEGFRSKVLEPSNP